MRGVESRSGLQAKLTTEVAYECLHELARLPEILNESEEGRPDTGDGTRRSRERFGGRDDAR